MEIVAKLGPNDNELARFLCLGDRMDLLDFCTKKVKCPQNSNKKQRGSVMNLSDMRWSCSEWCRIGSLRSGGATMILMYEDRMVGAHGKSQLPRTVRRQFCRGRLRTYSSQTASLRGLEKLNSVHSVFVTLGPTGHDNWGIVRYSEITGTLRFYMYSTGPPLKQRPWWIARTNGIHTCNSPRSPTPTGIIYTGKISSRE